MKRTLYILLIGILTPTLAGAQKESNRQWEYKMFAGYNLGGTTPLPLPAEIRAIRTWNPGISGTLAFHVTRWLSAEWGITSGLAIDVKGMSVETDVMYLNTRLVVGEGEHTGIFNGLFTGRNKTSVRNEYLVIPLLAAWHPIARCSFRMGGYVALNQDAKFEGQAFDGYIRNGGPAGDRINVEMSAFDFSDRIRKTDAGLMALADWFFTNKLAITGQCSWGLLPLFPPDFNGIPYKMYNIYFSGGIAYKL